MSFGGTAPSADLGGSSKYSNENFEGRSGEGFHENSNWSWVTRSSDIGKPLSLYTWQLDCPISKGNQVNIPEAGCGFCGNTP